MYVRNSIFLALAIVLSTAAFADDPMVAYADGLVEYLDNGQWYEIFIGDQIPASSQLRLASDAFIELSAGATTVQISKPGLYSIEDLLQSSQIAQAAPARSGRISRLVSNRAPDSAGSVVGGVRASEAVDRDQTLWAGGADAMELIRDGLDMLAAEDYQSAYWFFEEAYDAAQDNEEAEVGFYFGFSAALMGNTREAIDVLERYPMDPATSYYHDHVLTLAQVLLETAAYEDAVSILDGYLESSSIPAQLRQEALFLRGIGLNSLDRDDDARADLNAAIAIDTTTPTADSARELLSSM